VSERKLSWHKPQLIVLARSKPEEAVLTGCKSAGYTATSQGNGTCELAHTGQCVMNVTS